MSEQKNHPEYNEFIDYYKQVRVFTRGHKQVQNYLQPVTIDLDVGNITRNRDYKARAKYTNFPKRTKNALVGAAFRKDEEVELPTKLEYLIGNANGAGKTLNQVSKNLVTNLVEIGRHGILTDFNNDTKLAKIVTYTAENITDWNLDSNGVLNFVELITGDNTKTQLTINEDIYNIVLFEDDEIIDTIIPTDFSNSTFDVIPFTFVGSVDNSPDVDDMPLWSIVDVTQGHYQNSADYEDILRYQLPTPYIAGMTTSYLKEVYINGKIEYGSGAMITAPDGASVGLLQANANQMHQVAMNEKENQLVMLGARLVEASSGQETAEAVRIKFSAENGILSNLVGNASSAMKKAIMWCGQFMGTDEEVIYNLNQDFWDSSMSAQETSAEILLLDRGAIAMTDLRSTLRKNGKIAPDRTDDDIDSEAENTAGGLSAK